MNITLRGTDFYVLFEYSVKETKLGVRDVTSCIWKNNGVPVVVGNTIRNPKDCHVKEIARVQSMREVLKQLELTKQERSEIWSQYLKR